jgi:hypothetical protein
MMLLLGRRRRLLLLLLAASSQELLSAWQGPGRLGVARAARLAKFARTLQQQRGALGGLLPAWCNTCAACCSCRHDGWSAATGYDGASQAR